MKHLYRYNESNFNLNLNTGLNAGLPPYYNRDEVFSDIEFEFAEFLDNNSVIQDNIKDEIDSDYQISLYLYLRNKEKSSDDFLSYIIDFFSDIKVGILRLRDKYPNI